jgi:hypothetical protein
MDYNTITETPKETRMYAINLTHKANTKIDYWVNKATGEVSGFGIGTYDSIKKEFTVVDAFLIEQTVGSAHTDISPEGMAKLMYETRMLEGYLNFWWHSHVNMPVFWSDTDRDTILKLGGNGFIFASVFNKKDEVRSACAFTATSELNGGKLETMFYDDIETFILKPELSKEFTDELDAQFTSMVKTPPPIVWTPKSGSSMSKEFLENNGFGMSRGYAEYDAMEYGDYSEVERIATMNIKNATNEPQDGFFDMEGTPLTNAELEQICTDSSGAFGFGFKDEAKVLDMSHKLYRRIIKNNNLMQLTNLEDKVLLAAAAGEIKHINSKA